MTIKATIRTTNETSVALSCSDVDIRSSSGSDRSVILLKVLMLPWGVLL